MASNMEYDSPYKSDSPFSYEVEDGELSCGSGRSSPGTIRDCASDCGTQTENQMETHDDKTITTFRVELENNPVSVQTPQDIARKIRDKFERRNLQSFNVSNTSTSEQGTNTRTNNAIHSYQNTRPKLNNNLNNNDTYMSPPYRTTHHQ